MQGVSLLLVSGTTKKNATLRNFSLEVLQTVASKPETMHLK